MTPRWELGPGESGLVSVIVTAFNQERFLTETLESVACQTYRPLECLIIDDGSTDGTPAIASTFANASSQDVAFKYFRQENQGSQAARNRGLVLSKGDYVQHLDGDDILSADKLRAQVDFFNSPAGLSAEVVYGDARFLVPSAQGFAIGELIGIGASDDFIASFLASGWNANFSYLCRRRAAQVTGPWDPAVVINQDYDYFLRMACHGCRFAYAPVQTGLYRKHGNCRISDKPILQRARSTLRILERAEDIARECDSLTHKRAEAFAKAYRRVSYWASGVDRSVWRNSLGAALRLCPDLKSESALGRTLQTVVGLVAAEAMLGMMRSFRRTGSAVHLVERSSSNQ